jgi:protein TonB
MTAAAIDKLELRRWVASAIVVLGLHAAAAGLLLTWPDPIAVGEPSDAIVVDLAPFAPPSDTVEDIAPGPKQQEEVELPPPEREKTEQKVEEKIEVPPAPVPPVAALPPPEPEDPKPPEPIPTPVPPAPATTAPPRAQAAPPAAVKKWFSMIVDQIERHKAYPQAAAVRGEKGIVQLAFSIDRDGHVLSSDIVHSSGYAALDQETIATVRRAQPFPPPPPDLAGAKFEFTVPVKFNVK